LPVPGANMPVAAFEFLDRLRSEEGDVVNLVREYFCDCKDALHRRDECPRLKGAEISERSTGRYVSVEANMRWGPSGAIPASPERPLRP